MSSSTRGWLVFAAMLVGALIAILVTANILQTYESRPGDHTGTDRSHSD